MQLFLFARFHARPGCQAALHQAISDVQGPTRKESGCLTYHVFRSVRDPDEFYIHSRWRDRVAFEHHAALPHTVHFVATIETLVDHPLSVSLTERLD
jgi:quinol monooxygenase YgiN